MSSYSLSRKLEKVLTLYMKSIIPTGLNIYEGHEKAAVITLPYLVCYAENSIPHPDMPTSAGVRIVSMRFELRVDSEESGARAALDAWREDVEDAVANVTAIKAFITALDFNWEGFIIHVYDVIQENEPTEFESTDWVEQFSAGVVSQLTPAPSPPP